MENVGVIGYACQSGIGRMVHDLRTHLGIKHQLVIPNKYPPVPEWLIGQMMCPTWEPSADNLMQWVTEKKLKTVISVETFFGSRTVERLQSLGCRTILLPMGEWFNPDDSQYSADLYICNSAYTFQMCAPRKRIELGWPVDLETIPFRLRAGPAVHFIHNAGNLGVAGRKGTDAAIHAFQATMLDPASDELRLTVRSQSDNFRQPDHPDIEYKIGTVPFEELYATGDVLLYPSQMDGHALVVEESMAAGMPCLATNAEPMNEFHIECGLEDLLIAVNHSSFAGTNNPNAVRSFVDTADLSARIYGCSQLDMESYSRRGRELIADRYSWDVLRGRYMELING